MIKYFIVLINMLALLVAQVFFSDGVNVKVEAPSKVKPGDEFTVTLIVNKGSIDGVSRLKQELPAELGNVTVVDGKTAEFEYLPEDNAVEFTWISLPSDQEFSVSYKVQVAATATGSVILAGKFSYILDNVKQTFMIPETSILVADDVMATTTQPETTTATTTTTTTEPETTSTSTQPETAKTTASVSAERTIVGSPEAGMEFTVEIVVKKSGVKGFARIQETLPAGLSAISLENKGGTFSFLDQKVKIIWDNLPADEEVKISYRVVVADDVSRDMALIGSFSYVENDDPKKVDINPSSITVKTKTELAIDTNTTTVTEPETTITSTPDPEKKVFYKIQICALSKRQRGTAYFESKYGISNKVSMEFHEGWRKYIVGKYNRYADASNYRENVRAKGVEGPFVTAYNNGKRITVQEGLMISSQKWVQ